MHSGQSNLRRAHLGVASKGEHIEVSESPRYKKKVSKSILFKRWLLRFFSFSKTSQVLLLVGVILMFLLTMVYFMKPLVSHGFLNRKRHRRRHSDDATHPVLGRKAPKFPEKQDDEIYDKYEIFSSKTLQKYTHRKAFPPLEPRVVRLTDKNHTLRFAFPPGHLSPTNSSSSFPLPERGQWELKKRYVELAMRNPNPMKEPEPLVKPGCEALGEWQAAYHPTCNAIHEISGGWQEFYRMPSNKKDKQRLAQQEDDVENREQIRLVNKGAFRHVWMVRDADGITKRAMKTLRSLRNKEKKFDLRNQDRHRRDAMSFEMLQESPLVVDLYAACSNTAIFDYADRGDILGIFDGETYEKTPEEAEKFNLHIMEIAYNVSLSVHDAHHFDAQGRATMAHTDIKADQFIYQDGYYKLSDFNRVRFLTWNPTMKEQCGFLVGKNGGEYRAPEEYMYELETEKVDVYSLGNVLYFLLTREEVWQNFKHNQVYDLVKAGQRPQFPENIYKSNEIFERTMIKAIESAWIHNPRKRPGALEVANTIKEGIELKKKEKTRRK